MLIRIYNKDKEILKQIKEFIKCGNIYTRKSNNVSELTISDKKACLNFLKGIYPYSVLKKRQIDYLFNNFIFELGKNNKNFDLTYFNSFKANKGKDKWLTARSIK